MSSNSRNAVIYFQTMRIPHFIFSLITTAIFSSCSEEPKTNSTVAIQPETTTDTTLVNNEETQTLDTSKIAENWIYAEDKKFTIKVDRLIDGTFQYTSWNKSKTVSDKPDLILNKGIAQQQGSAGGYHYIFKNNEWKYTIKDVWMAEQDEGMGIFMELAQDGEIKMDSKLTDLKTVPLSQLSIEDIKDQNTKSHYICYKNDNNSQLYIWIRFSDGKAKEVKYRGMDSSMKLKFEKESENLNPDGPYPVIAQYYNEGVNGKVNGIYKLTHSGNYDYAEYTRGKDSAVFNFTIDHQANPYGETPCF